MDKINIIIPIGGIGKRFSDHGYLKPKPLIKILGKEMIFWLLDNLKINDNYNNYNKYNNINIYIGYNKSLKDWDFERIIKIKYPNIKCICLNYQTRGATETILEIINNMNMENRQFNTICLDCDTFYPIDKIDIIGKYKQSLNKNNIICFEDYQDKPIFSYIKVYNDKIIDIQEKVKISNLANTGCYCFENCYLLKKYCEKIIKKNITFKNEFYTSCVIKSMLQDKIDFGYNIIKTDDFVCLGTPLQVRIFCDKINHTFEKKRICFDLDNTLVTSPTIKNDYSTVKPIDKNINMCKYLKKIGHTIIIYTARRMKTHNGNIGKINADISKLTIETLEKFNIPYDELYFGKPYAHYYIDDLSINAFNDLEKELGYYMTQVNEREFNNISSSKINTIIKKSKNDLYLLDGEIYWYNNIPNKIKDLFPVMINYNNNMKEYQIEKINGIPISSLFINNELTIEILNAIIDCIERIHSIYNIDSKNSNINIYGNYSNKIKKRYLEYKNKIYNKYDKYENHQNIFDQLVKYFNNYEKNKLGHKTIIHGDPVFSNILIDQCNKLKFIDMRGKIGNDLTLCGDKWYDYGKIYQSLIGYDEILLEKNVDNAIKNNLIRHFEDYINETFGNDKLIMIKYITASLLFTLIPLHDCETTNTTNKCLKYYNLCQKIMSQLENH